MRLLLVLTAAVFSLLSANAQAENDLVVSAGDAKEIVLGDDMNVVFLSAAATQENLGLTKTMLQKLDVKFYDDKVEIAPRRALRNQTVYVVVGDVKEVTVGQNTNVRSRDILPSSKIDLYINQGARAAIKTVGKIQAYSLGNFDLEIIRKPIFSGSTVGTN